MSSRVTVRVDLANFPILSEEDKALIASRRGKDGVLRVVSRETRSLAPNRSEEKRASARAAKLRRQEGKKQCSSLKHGRSKTP